MDARERKALESLDEYRREAGPLENDLIDELVEGGIDRAGFIKAASMLGFSASVAGSALTVFGGGAPAFAKPIAKRAGGRLRLGCNPSPVAAIEPHLFVETGQIVTGTIMGEYLTHTTPQLTVAPELAVSWTPNKDASVWTYKLRTGVKFANGKSFGADDVVATYNRLVDPDQKSQALSAFGGVLSKGNIKKIDDSTVQFTLDAPTASFPFLTSNTTYAAIIVPADYKLGTFMDTPGPTTGAFRLKSFTPAQGAVYDRNPNWWGGQAPLDGVDMTYYDDDAPMNAALISGQLDLINSTVASVALPLINNPNLQVLKANGTTHREISMAVDMNPNLKDPRVRQAIAMTLDRPSLVKKLFSGFAQPGNDSCFAPAYPFTAKLPQRHKDLAKAKALMAAAGKSAGFKLHLTTWKNQELPQLAAIVKQSLKAINIDVTIEVQTSKKYFGGKYEGGKFGLGDTPWLNTEFNITDWGHRAVPNVYLTASLISGGIWNASHYKNKSFDANAKKFLAAIALSDQKKYAKLLQLQMLKDTPVIYPYFYQFLAAGKKSIKGYSPDPIAGVFLGHTSLS